MGGLALHRHLMRKTPCTPIIKPEDLSENILNDPDLAERQQKKCRFCGRIFIIYCRSDSRHSDGTSRELRLSFRRESKALDVPPARGDMFETI